MKSQIEMFKDLTPVLGEDKANDLVNFIVDTKGQTDDKFLTQKDKVEILEKIDKNFKWGVGMFIMVMLALFGILIKLYANQ